MKRLILIRHAKTEALQYGFSDIERQLEQRGIRDAGQIAQHLSDKGYRPGLMVCSNASRALQTCHIMAETVGYPVFTIHSEGFIYDGYTTADFLDFLGRQDNHHHEIWVVGHNPDIAMLATKLTNDHFDHYPTCAAAVIEFENDQWADVAARSGKVAYFVFPRELK